MYKFELFLQADVIEWQVFFGAGFHSGNYLKYTNVFIYWSFMNNLISPTIVEPGRQQVRCMPGKANAASAFRLSFQGSLKIIKPDKPPVLSKDDQLLFESNLKDALASTSRHFGLLHTPEIRFHKSPPFFSRNAGQGLGIAKYVFSKNKLDVYCDTANLYKFSVLSPEGHKQLVLDKDDRMPMIMDFNSLNEMAATARLYYNCVIEPVTLDEAKRFFELAIAHECQHASQFQLMRQTQGIGLQGIIDARKKAGSKHFVTALLNVLNNDRLAYQYWSKLASEENKFPVDSVEGKQARKYLESLENTNTIQAQRAPDVYRNFYLEQDAFAKAADYLEQTRGSNCWGAVLPLTFSLV